MDGEFLPIEPTLHLPSWVDLFMSHNRAWIVDGNAAFRAAERSAARRERRGAVRRRRARRAVAMRRRHARHAAATAAGQPPAVPQRCSARIRGAAMTPPQCGYNFISFVFI